MALLNDGWRVVAGRPPLEPLQQVIEESGAGERGRAVPPMCPTRLRRRHCSPRGEGLRPRRRAVQQRRRERARRRSKTHAEQWKRVVDINLTGMFCASSRPSA
jgi:hypothetical protein